MGTKKPPEKPALELNIRSDSSLLDGVTRNTCEMYTDLDHRIQNLDLARIIWKMGDPEEGKGFTPQRLAQAEMDYRRFLHLHLLYPGLEIVPTKLIDEVWHQHILDTRAYAKDCQELFGEFLHHYPYFGMHGEDDQANLQTCFERTQKLWIDCFGIPMFETQAVRCEGHACHAPSTCACRSPGACK